MPRLTIKLRDDGGRMVTSRVDVDGDVSQERVDAAMRAAKTELTGVVIGVAGGPIDTAANVVTALKRHGIPKKTSRLGADTRSRTTTREPKEDSEE